MEVNYTEIAQFINSVGFPIFVAIFMMFINYKSNKEHANELRVMGDAIDNNTLAMANIKTELETLVKFLRGDKHE